jgi:L-ectoine synthase
MIVRTLQELIGTERDVHDATWNSRRLLLKADGMGFSLHDTLIHAGTQTRMCYRNHLEAVYCIEGQGEIEALATGQRHAIVPGTVYALDRHDDHVLYAHSALRLVCVFNPPLTGLETHGSDGAYPPDPDPDPDPELAPREVRR